MKIKLCEMCFQNTDLKRNEVEIISEEECILRELRYKKTQGLAKKKIRAVDLNE